MIRQKEASKVRDDAVRMGVTKLLQGCQGCAEGYFDLARKNGASDSDIDEAVKAAADRSIDDVGSSFSRRSFIKAAAATTTTVAAQAALAPVLSATAAAQAAGRADARAWLSVSEAAGPDVERRIVTIDGTGKIVGSTRSMADGFLMLNDRVAGFVREKSGRNAQVIVELFDRRDASYRGSAQGASLPLHAETDVHLVTAAAASPDGRQLAVLHQTQARDVAAGTRKEGPNGNEAVQVAAGELIDSLELFDIRANRSSALIAVNRSSASMFGGEVVWSPDGSRLYLLTLNRDFNDVITVVGAGAGSLSVERRATNGEQGHLIPASGLPVDRTSRVLPDNRTLVRFAAPRQVQVIDLNRLTLISSVDIEWAPCEACAKKAAPTALYAPDSSLLYVVNGSSGQVAAIDLRAHAAARTSSLPLTGSIRPSGRPSTTGVPDAVVSADGHTLYAIDARSDPPVVWTIGLPALEPLAYWTPGRSLVAVSRDDAERVLFALGGDGLVYGVASNSTIFTAAVPNVAAVTGFLASGSL